MGLGSLLNARRIRRTTGSYVGEDKEFERRFLSGELEVELVRTLAERLRAGGAGIPASYTPGGVGTQVAVGGLPLRYAADGSVAVAREPQEVRSFDGRDYVLECAITCDFALVHARYGDRHGNLVYEKSAQNFNPLCAAAGRITIAEVEKLLEPGELDPMLVHTPGVFVQRVVYVPGVKKRIERRTVSCCLGKLAARVVLELVDGQYVNLGIGLPTLVPNYVPACVHVVLQSENGVLGVGPYPTDATIDPDLINAGKETVTLLPGGFVLRQRDVVRDDPRRSHRLGDPRRSAGVRAGRPRQLDDPREDGQGDGRRDGRRPRRQALVMTEHAARAGTPKIVGECSLPYTGRGCIQRVITDLAVLDVTPDGLVLRELAPGSRSTRSARSPIPSSQSISNSRERLWAPSN